MDGVLGMLLLSTCLLQPPMPDGREVGPFRVSHDSQFTWPGLLMPDFRVAMERRWMHRFALSFSRPGLRLLSLEATVVEPPQLTSDAAPRNEVGPGLPGPRALSPTAFMAARVAVPGRRLSVSVGRPSYFGGPGGFLRGAGVPKLMLTGRM
jgi:hypothetical protein